MTLDELMEFAERVSESRPETAGMALEMIAGHGMADEEIGLEGLEPASIVRVEEWILTTDSQGFAEVERCHSILEAELRVEAFEKGDSDG